MNGECHSNLRQNSGVRERHGDTFSLGFFTPARRLVTYRRAAVSEESQEKNIATLAKNEEILNKKEEVI